MWPSNPTIGERHPPTGFIDGKAWQYIDNDTWNLIKPEGISDINTHVGSILYVTNMGNNDTAERGNFGRPYQTLEVAKDNALEGDLIYVYKGTYVGNDLLKHNISYYFEPDCTITGTTILTRADTANPALNCNIFGYPNIESVDRGFFVMNCDGVNIYAELNNLFCTNDNGLRVHSCLNVNIKVDIKNRTTGRQRPFIVAGDVTGVIKIKSKEAQITHSGGSPNATLVLDAVASSDNLDVYLNVDEVLSNIPDRILVAHYKANCNLHFNLKNKAIFDTPYDANTHLIDHKWGNLYFNGDIEGENAHCYGHTFNGAPGEAVIDGKFKSNNSPCFYLARPDGNLNLNSIYQAEGTTSGIIRVVANQQSIKLNGKLLSETAGNPGIVTVSSAEPNLKIKDLIIDTLGECILAGNNINVDVSRHLHYTTAPNSNVTLISNYNKFPTVQTEGSVLITGVLGETVNIGQPVFQDTDGKWKLAKASEGFVANLSICVEGGDLNDIGKFSRYIVLSNLSGLPNTTNIYLSQDTEGEYTSVKPETGYIIYIGKTEDTTKLTVSIGQVGYDYNEFPPYDQSIKTGTIIDDTFTLTATEIFKKNIFDNVENKVITIPDNIMAVGQWASFEIIGAGVPEFEVAVGTINEHDLADRILVYVYRSENDNYIVI